MEEDKLIFGMHALGMYEGQTYTNAKEALLYWYGKGIRFFEADVAIADSGKMVMGHPFKRRSGSKLTFFTLQEFLGIVQAYKDCRFVFDPYSLCEEEHLKRFVDEMTAYPEFIEMAGRVYVETYSERATEILHDRFSGTGCLPNFVACLKGQDKKTKKNMCGYSIENVHSLIDILRRQGIKRVSFQWEQAKNNKSLLLLLHKEKFKIMSLSRTNFGAEEKKENYISVNLVDFCVQKNTVIDFFIGICRRLWIHLIYACGLREENYGFHM